MVKLFNKKWIRRFIVYLPEYIASVALVTTIVATGINVFTRYILKFTYFWYSDILVLAFGWMVCTGAAAAYRRHMHFGIDMLVNRLPDKVKLVFQVFLNILLCLIIALVLYSGILLTHNVYGKQLPTILLSYKWYDSSIIVGFGYMLIYACIDVVKSFSAALHAIKRR